MYIYIYPIYHIDSCAHKFPHTTFGFCFGYSQVFASIREYSIFAICFALFNSINILYIFMIAANSVKLLPKSLPTSSRRVCVF